MRNGTKVEALRMDHSHVDEPNATARCSKFKGRLSLELGLEEGELLC